MKERKTEKENERTKNEEHLLPVLNRDEEKRWGGKK